VRCCFAERNNRVNISDDGNETQKVSHDGQSGVRGFLYFELDSGVLKMLSWHASVKWGSWQGVTVKVVFWVIK
jgi:hypothetical protein